MSDQKDIAWQFKDSAVAVPLLASSLAITWQVGRFAPTGGFENFSLSDHLVAAMAALPTAFAMATFLGFSILLLSATGKTTANETGRPMVGALTMIVPFVAVSIAYRFFTGTAYETSDFVMGAAFVLLMVNVTWLKYPLTGPHGIISLFLVAMLLSMTLSSELTQRDLIRADRGTKLSAITTKSGTYKAHVLMAGERGLLTYNPETKSVAFQRADELRSFEWKPK